MDRELLASILYNKLPKYRWFPWRKPRAIHIETFLSYNNSIYTILSIEDKFFYLPLRITDKPPSFLPSERVIEVDSGYLVEAEFTTDYIPSIRRSGYFSEELVSPYPLLERASSVEPVTLESSNVIVHYGCELGGYVVKSYRLLSRYNLEPEMLKILTLKNYMYTPRLYSIYRLGEYVVSIAIEYIRGEGDGGKPFYEALYETLSSGKRVHRIGLASLLGVEVALFHKILSSYQNQVYTPEDIGSGDIDKWCNRIGRLYRLSLRNLDMLSREYSWVDKWRIFVEDKIGVLVDKAVDVIDRVYRGLKKNRIHQDLHLAQFIYSRERGFILTDLEGEPAREDTERIEKEPVFRDIASLIRSFDYLSFSCIQGVLGRDTSEIGWLLVDKGDPSIEWKTIHTRALVNSYLFRIGRDSIEIIGCSIDRLLNRINDLIYPWIVERGLYELYYESMYRPENIPIPVSTLYASPYTKKEV